MGIMMSAYFSAILSTADCCLMAASGNMLTDILQKIFPGLHAHPRVLVFTQGLTLLLGMFAMLLAASMTNVLELMLYSYAFMVSGLFVPLIAAMFLGQTNWMAALTSMIGGGCTTVLLTTMHVKLPFSLDPNIFGIAISLFLFVTVSFFLPKSKISTL
jgi:SSS family solute:Na+ symporter